MVWDDCAVREERVGVLREEYSTSARYERGVGIDGNWRDGKVEARRSSCVVLGVRDN